MLATREISCSWRMTEKTFLKLLRLVLCLTGSTGSHTVCTDAVQGKVWHPAKEHNAVNKGKMCVIGRKLIKNKLFNIDSFFKLIKCLCTPVLSAIDLWGRKSCI